MQDLEYIRNIGVIAHIDAGKTSTTEAFLFLSGLTHRVGSIDQGTTVMDFLPEERARGITIRAAAATLPWDEHLIHLIDTPGHIDFTAEVERSLRVIDGAVVIFSAVEGVEAQSEKVWRQADKYGVPKLAFINKLDRVGASFPRVLGEVNERFGDCALALHEPLGIEDEFEELIDLVRMELVRFSGEHNEVVERLPVPEQHAAVAEAGREALIERLADESDAFAEVYLEGEEITVALLEETIRELTLSGAIVPVLAGTAKKTIGIQPLMSAVVSFLPSPADVGAISAHRVKGNKEAAVEADDTAPFSGLIFKVVASASADLFYLRTYSGTLKANATVCNARTGAKVRAKQLLRLYAKSTETLPQVGPGDIVGIIGPKDCGTGDTLCDTHRLISFEQIVFPEPVISMAIEPRYSRDKDKLDGVLSLLCREDPTLMRTEDEETGQRILSGMGELHLEINLKRLLQEFSLETKVGEPRVAYRETLQKRSTERAVFEKTLGETELFAAAEVLFEPVSRSDTPVEVTNSLRNKKSLPRDLVAAAERALAEGLRTGGNHGYPLVYLRADLHSLTVHPEKTTEGAVVGVVLQAIDQAIRNAGTRVLEPLMHLEILAPDATVGEISMYLQPRRAIIHEMASVNDIKRISCEVPLAEMFGFGKALPKLSGGRATFSMEPCGYQELPDDVADRLFGMI